MNKIVFYFKTIKRGGSEIALLRYFKTNKQNEDKILIYSDNANADPEMVEDFKQVVNVYNIKTGEKLNADVAVNCSIYDVDDEIFENIDAKKYVFWAQVNPFFGGRYEDLSKLRRYDSFLATSEYIKKCILDRLPDVEDKTYIATPIVDKQEIVELAKEKQSIIIKKDKKYNIITVARYSPSKGYNHNVEIANLLKKKGIEFTWYSLGFIPDNRRDFYNQMQEKIKDYGLEENMLHIGVDKNPYKYVKGCDLNVLFSTDEAWGLVVTEAKILGLPNIVSNIGGLAEQVNEDFDGKKYALPQNQQDYEKIAQCIASLLKNSNEYYKMKENLVDFNYDIENIVKTMNECFKI